MKPKKIDISFFVLILALGFAIYLKNSTPKSRIESNDPIHSFAH